MQALVTLHIFLPPGSVFAVEWKLFIRDKGLMYQSLLYSKQFS